MKVLQCNLILTWWVIIMPLIIRVTIILLKYFKRLADICISEQFVQSFSKWIHSLGNVAAVFAFLSVRLQNGFCFVSGISQRYNRRLLLGLQLNTIHHPLQIMLKYCLRSLRLLFTNRKLSENLMFKKAHKPILFFKHVNNVI